MFISFLSLFYCFICAIAGTLFVLFMTVCLMQCLNFVLVFDVVSKGIEHFEISVLTKSKMLVL